MSSTQKPFNLVEAHKHEMSKKDENTEKKEGESEELSDAALTEIQKLLYGKANLAEIIV
tara:strand:- start:789 stop:965 length:177 start_codon:yes stop_codon:yes gene_type:complete